MTPGNFSSPGRVRAQAVTSPLDLSKAAAQTFVRVDATILLIALIILVGASARFYGLEWGLPYHFHTDERFMAVSAENLRTTDSIARLTDQPYFFLYPPLLSYLLIGLVNVVGFFNPFSPIEPAGGTLYYSLARGITACFGSATLVLVYFLGKRLYNKSAGLLAAAFLALSVLHVRDSHFYTTDVPFTFFVVLVALLAAEISEKGGLQFYVLSGIFTGLGLATKQTALMVLPMIMAAHVLASLKNNEFSWDDVKAVGFSRRFWQLLILPIAIAGFTFIALDPFVLMNPRRFLQMIQILHQFVSGTHQHYWSFQFTGTTITYWFTNLLFYGMGPWLELVCMLGILWALWKRKAGDMLILAFLLPYFCFIGTGYMKFVRYAVPLLPFLCLLGARLLVNLWEAAGAKRTRAAVAASIVIVIAASGFYTLAYLNIYRQEDIRIQAAKWIHRELPAGSNILIDSSAATPLIGSRFFRPEFFSRTVVENQMYVTKQDYFNIKIVNLLTNPPRPPMPPSWWEAYLQERLADVDYVIMSNEHYEQYSHRADTYPAVDRFYRELLRGELGYRLIKSFEIHPALFGYVLNDDRAELTFRLFDHPKVWIFRRDGAADFSVSESFQMTS